MSLDKNASTQVPPQVCRVKKITQTTAQDIKAKLDTTMNLGWYLNQIVTIGSDQFAIFTRPKNQA